MHKQDFICTVTLLDIDDLAAAAAPYARWVRETPRGKAIFNAVMNAGAFVQARVATTLELPAVAGIAMDVVAAAEADGAPLESFEKQAIGAIMRTLMEENGYRKTGIKRAIPHPAFTKGELYEPPD